MTNEVLWGAGLVELTPIYPRRRAVYINFISSLIWRLCFVIGEDLIRDDSITTPYAQIRPQIAGHPQKPQTKLCPLIPHISRTRHACRNL